MKNSQSQPTPVPTDDKKRYRISINLMRAASEDERSSTAGDYRFLNITARTQELLDGLQEAVCLVSRKHNVLFWNRAMVKLSGVGKRTADGSPLTRLLPDELTRFLNAKIDAAFAGKRQSPGEFTISYDESELFAFKYRLLCLREIAEEPLVLLSLIDTSDTHRYYKAKERQEHLSTIGDLSISVAHELTAPLNRICSEIDEVVARLGLSDQKRLEKHLGSVVDNVYRISALAHNLVALSRQSNPSHLNVDINEQILDSIDTYEADLGRKLNMNLRLAAEAPGVLCDPSLLTLALHNIFRVADEFAGEDAVPRLSILYDRESPKIVKVRIEDRGPRLSEDAMRTLLDVTTVPSRVSPGASLALLISKKLLETQGCSLEIRNGDRVGTLFELQLPALSLSNINRTAA